MIKNKFLLTSKMNACLSYLKAKVRFGGTVHNLLVHIGLAISLG